MQKQTTCYVLHMEGSNQRTFFMISQIHHGAGIWKYLENLNDTPPLNAFCRKQHYGTCRQSNDTLFFSLMDLTEWNDSWPEIVTVIILTAFYMIF